MALDHLDKSLKAGQALLEQMEKKKKRKKNTVDDLKQSSSALFNGSTFQSDMAESPEKFKISDRNSSGIEGEISRELPRELPIEVPEERFNSPKNSPMTSTENSPNISNQNSPSNSQILQSNSKSKEDGKNGKKYKLKTANQHRLYYYLMDNNGMLHESRKDTCANTGVKLHNLKKLLEKWRDIGFLTYQKKANEFNEFFALVEVVDPKVLVTSKSREEVGYGKPVSPANSQNDYQPNYTENYPRTIPPLEREKENLLSESESEVWRMSQKHMSDCWPHLTQDGWGPRQLRDLKPIFERKGYEPEAIPMSMNYMEYILSQGIELKDKDGNLVKKPYAYLFGILKQDGIFKRPEGYIDPALLYKEQKLADEKAKRALEEELLQQELAREASNIFNNGPGDELFDQAFLKIPKTHQAWYQHGQKTVIVKKSLTVQIEKLLLGE